MRLKDQVAIVTGAASGFGAEIARRYALEGARVVIVDLNESGAQKVAAEMGWQVRVAMRDGEAFMLTQDFQTNRVNLTITKGLVTDVVIG